MATSSWKSKSKVLGDPGSFLLSEHVHDAGCPGRTLAALSMGPSGLMGHSLRLVLGLHSPIHILHARTQIHRYCHYKNNSIFARNLGMQSFSALPIVYNFMIAEA